MPTEDKVRADSSVEIKLMANEYTKNSIKLAHNAFESYEFELNQIESAKTIEEIIHEINDQKTGSVFSCLEYIQENENLINRCIYTKYSTHLWCLMIERIVDLSRELSCGNRSEADLFKFH